MNLVCSGGATNMSSGTPSTVASDTNSRGVSGQLLFVPNGSSALQCASGRGGVFQTPPAAALQLGRSPRVHADTTGSGEGVHAGGVQTCTVRPMLVTWSG